MRTRSLVRQVILSVLLLELLCALAFTGLALLHERRIRLRAFDVMLQGRSDSLLGAIQDAEDPEDNVQVDRSELALPPSDVFAVYNRGGRLLGSSENGPPELTERHGEGFSTRTVKRHSYRVLERVGMRVIDRAESKGVGLRRPVTIVYAVRSDRMWHEVFEAAQFNVMVSVLLIVGTAAVMILLLRRVLEPIGALATAAGAVSSRSLYFRAPSAALRVRELRPLATSLETAVEGLRRAFEAEQRFVGDAAHELKTAVAVMRSSVQLLMMRSRLAEEYAAGLGDVLDDTARLEDLVARMLTLASMEENDGSGARYADLAGVTEVVVRRLQNLAGAVEVTVAVEAAGVLCVGVSAEKLEALVSNLVVNAIQHSPRASRVEVTVREEDERATLRVSDRGYGISAEALPHVFERFYREDRSRSRETGGAGLGLAICRSIVDAAQGSITIQSEPGQGTSVAVSLPRLTQRVDSSGTLNMDRRRCS